MYRTIKDKDPRGPLSFKEFVKYGSPTSQTVSDIYFAQSRIQIQADSSLKQEPTSSRMDVTLQYLTKGMPFVHHLTAEAIVRSLLAICNTESEMSYTSDHLNKASYALMETVDSCSCR